MDLKGKDKNHANFGKKKKAKILSRKNPTVEDTEAEVAHIGCRYSGVGLKKALKCVAQPIAHRLGCTHTRVFLVKLGVMKSITMNNILFLIE
jgi:hypothetical protein